MRSGLQADSGEDEAGKAGRGCVAGVEVCYAWKDGGKDGRSLRERWGKREDEMREPGGLGLGRTADGLECGVAAAGVRPRLQRGWE